MSQFSKQQIEIFRELGKSDCAALIYIALKSTGGKCSSRELYDALNISYQDLADGIGTLEALDLVVVDVDSVPTTVTLRAIEQ